VHCSPARYSTDTYLTDSELPSADTLWSWAHFHAQHNVQGSSASRCIVDIILLSLRLSYRLNIDKWASRGFHRTWAGPKWTLNVLLFALKLSIIRGGLLTDFHVDIWGDSHRKWHWLFTPSVECLHDVSPLHRPWYHWQSLCLIVSHDRVCKSSNNEIDYSIRHSMVVSNTIRTVVGRHLTMGGHLTMATPSLPNSRYNLTTYATSR
jgi:hypothetical protein